MLGKQLLSSVVFRSAFTLTRSIVSSTKIPVVDFRGIFPDTNLANAPQIQELKSALTDVRAVYIKNHGIDNKLLEKTYAVGLDFYRKPEGIKNKYRYNPDEEGNTKHNGYIGFGQESYKGAVFDLTEAFEISDANTAIYPDKDAPEFRPVYREFFHEGKKAALKILNVLSHVIDCKDPDYFSRVHSDIGQGTRHNYSSIRSVYYPPIATQSVGISDEVEIRTHSHLDYSTMTLLFPDPIGGLQVQNTNGEWCDVPYVEDGVLVLLGTLMNYWSGDKFQAALHRVLSPKDEDARRRHRMSLAVFVHPNADTIVQSLNGASKRSILASDHMNNIIKETII